MTRVLLFVLALGACSDLSDIDTNVCGNGILESGEDCDASDPRCVACGIRCDAGEGADGDAQCAAYPGAAGFVCGADAFCHAPSGRFRPPTDISTAIETFRATDVDHDGYGDILVQSATAVRVLFGNADGHPTTSQQVLTPIARGAASYADLDADGKLDIMLPAADGIVAYTSPYDVLSPFPFPSIVSTASEGRPYFSNQITPGFIGFVGVMPNAQSPAQAYYFVRDVTDDTPMPFVAVAPLCTATDQTFDPHAVSIFDVRQDYQLLAASYREAGQMKLCVIAIERVAGNYTLTNLTVDFGATRSPASRAVLAPIGAGACPSIVVREQLGASPPGDIVALAGTGTTTCSYSAAPVVRTLSATGGDPVGWARLTPPDPGTNATVALALSNAVYAVPATGPLAQLLYIADRPLAAIDSADFDNDGDVDIVATSATPAGEPVEDLDVLSRFDMGFVRYRADTDGPADLLTIGDYDGNGIRDVGYVQTRVIGGANRYELMIAYATTDKLLPGISVGTYGKIISLIVGDIPDSNDPFGVVSDLVVLFEDFGQTAITLLHGSPQRTMLGFFDPRAGQVPTIFRGAVAGQFNDAQGPPGLDLLAIDDGDLGTPRVWRSNGPTGSQVAMETPFTVSLLSDCNRPGPATNLCIDGAIHVAWPTSPTADRVIAFGRDRSGAARVITFDPHVEPPAFPAAEWPALAELPSTARIRSADVVLANDTPRLVVTFIQGVEAHVLVCDVDATGLPARCTDVAAQISQQRGAGVTCTHVTAARFAPVTRFMDAPPVARDLVAICYPAATPDAATLFALDANLTATELMFVGCGHELRVGDVDGNGIDDFLVVDRGGQVPTMRIYRQCTSREVATCGL